MQDPRGLKGPPPPTHTGAWALGWVVSSPPRGRPLEVALLSQALPESAPSPPTWATPSVASCFAATRLSLLPPGPGQKEPLTGQEPRGGRRPQEDEAMVLQSFPKVKGVARGA